MARPKKEDEYYIDLTNLRNFLLMHGCNEQDLMHVLKTKSSKIAMMNIFKAKQVYTPAEPATPIVKTITKEVIVPVIEKDISKDTEILDLNRQVAFEKDHSEFKSNTIHKMQIEISELTQEVKDLTRKLDRKLNYEKKISQVKPGIPQYIDEIDSRGDTVRSFTSIKEASRITGCGVTGIRNCLIGLQKQTGGKRFAPAKKIPPKKCPKCLEYKEIDGNYRLLKSGRVQSYCIPCEKIHAANYNAKMRERMHDPLPYYIKTYGHRYTEAEIVMIYNEQLRIAEEERVYKTGAAYKFAYTTTDRLLNKGSKDRRMKEALEKLDGI